MAKFILLRHAESEANRGDFINDDPKKKICITDLGHQQARIASEKLRQYKFTRAFASEFIRAQQTAEIVLEHHACQLRIDSRLNERLSGLDGEPASAFHLMIAHDRVHGKTERGESFHQQMMRLKNFLDDVADDYSGEVILAVSHEDPIRSALALINGDPHQSTFLNIPNAHWVELDWPPDNCQGVQF